MNLKDQIGAATSAREQADADLSAQITALQNQRAALARDAELDRAIALHVRAREILPHLTNAQTRAVQDGKYDGRCYDGLYKYGMFNSRHVLATSGVTLTKLGGVAQDILKRKEIPIPMLRRVAKYAIDAHFATGENDAERSSVDPDRYSWQEFAVYLQRETDPVGDLYTLYERLAPSQARQLLLCMLPARAPKFP